MTRRAASPLQSEVPAEDAPSSPVFSMALMENRLGLRLRFAQHRVFQMLGQAFAPFDITLLLFTILNLIEDNPGCRQAELGLALAIKQPNLVERIDYLCARGLITRVKDPNDRRAKVLALTDAGRRVLGEMNEIEQVICQSFIDRLGERDHAVLIDLLRRLTDESGSPRGG